jgi:hypothetical protein
MKEERLEVVVSVRMNDKHGRGIPEWARKALVCRGVVYMPACIVTENEAAVASLAEREGAWVMHNRGHAYLPTDWIARKYPELAGDLAWMAESIRRTARKGTAVDVAPPPEREEQP